jgi:hypothetical protein
MEERGRRGWRREEFRGWRIEGGEDGGPPERMEGRQRVGGEPAGEEVEVLHRV